MVQEDLSLSEARAWSPDAQMLATICHETRGCPHRPPYQRSRAHRHIPVSASPREGVDDAHLRMAWHHKQSEICSRLKSTLTSILPLLPPPLYAPGELARALTHDSPSLTSSLPCHRRLGSKFSTQRQNGQILDHFCDQWSLSFSFHPP